MQTYNGNKNVISSELKANTMNINSMLCRIKGEKWDREWEDEYYKYMMVKKAPIHGAYHILSY